MISMLKKLSLISFTALYILSFTFILSCKTHIHAYGRWTGKDSCHFRLCDCGYVWEADHVWDGNSCLVCKFTPDYTLNLAYERGNGGYLVTGRGKAEGAELVLPSSYDGVPVFVKEQAFRSDNLTSVTLDGVVEIGASAFAFCPLLKTVDIGYGLISLGANAFQACGLLENVALPESLQTIGANAFSGCSKIESIDLGGILQLDAPAFSSCTGLKNITVSPNNEIYYSEDNAIIEKSNKKLILGSVCGTVADGVEVIGASAFQFRNLKTLYMPASVKRVEVNAFVGCLNLDTVYFGGTAADWGKIIFDGGNSPLTGVKNIIYNYSAGK